VYPYFQALLGRDHAEVRATLFRRHHSSYFFFRRQPKVGFDDPPVRVDAGTFEIGALFQTFTNTAFGVRRKGLFNVVHTNAFRRVFTAPE
jgi:hypothetical protein